jgi:AcrR family transcriptional regulator
MGGRVRDDHGDADPAAPGRPRSQRSRRAILAATGELLREQGLRSMSIEGIAARAGVSKSTIYRWWPSKGVLALDAIYEEWTAERGIAPDTGTLAGDLRSRVRATVRVLSADPLGATIADLIAEAQADRELAEAYGEHVLGPLRAQLRAILRRAVARGELSPAVDAEAAIDLVQGAVFLRLLHTHAPLDRDFGDAIVEIACDGLLSAAGRGRPADR